MLTSMVIQPREAFIEIARNLLQAREIDIGRIDSQDIDAQHNMKLLLSDKPRFIGGDLRGLEVGAIYLKKHEATWQYALKLDQELALYGILQISMDEKSIYAISAHLQACSSSIFPEQSFNVRRPDLPDRRQCQAHLAMMIEASEASSKRLPFGVIALTLDRLRTLNLHQGWETSDFIIDKALERTRATLPSGSGIFYAGGGHIIGVTPLSTTLVHTKSLVAALRSTVSRPFSTPTGDAHASFSIAWALFPEDGTRPESLLKAIDVALSESHRRGGGYERRARTSDISSLIDETNLERDLELALQNNGLTLNWMPILSPRTQTVIALEALLRWERQGYGAIPPDQLIRCAENAGLIERLDQWSLQTACNAAAAWSHPLRVCVNISPAWLANKRLSSTVEQILSETGIDPSRLQIELSEKRPFGPSDIAYQELSRLRALGVQVALDDFGAGFSSLKRLAELPVDQIKLDRSFMQRLNDDRRVNEVVCHTIQLAQRLGISCCAKGVETERQMAFLDSQGCEEVQGYLLGSPVPEYL